MIFEKVELSEGCTLDVYVADKIGNEERRPLLVIPGGYGKVCAYKEGEPIAMAFMLYATMPSSSTFIRTDLTEWHLPTS